MTGSILKISAVVFAYFMVSIALVFSNKVLMTPGKSIPAPIFVTWFQCVLTAMIIYALGLLGRGSVKGEIMNEFPSQDYNIQLATKVFPLSFIFVGMVTFNNLCLQYVEVSFYNVARSLTIVINVILTYIMLHERTSIKTLGCLLLVIIGFFIGSDGEVNFSLIGTMFGVLSSLFVSLNSIYTKKVMPLVNDDKWKLSFYNNMNASIMFVPMIFLAGEHKIIEANFELFYSSSFWCLMIIAGILGFLIGIVTVMQITLTSPLTHNISGTAKACVQTILALWIWKNPTTTKALFGVFLTIFGSMAYAWVRMNETAKPTPVAVDYKPVQVQDTDEDIELQTTKA